MTNVQDSLKSGGTCKEYDKIISKIKRSAISEPISDLRNRMILLLMVITASIAGALFLFTKDIVAPMEQMVTATKQIADGDLTVKVPIMSEDEIGLVGGLINDMNSRLHSMIMEMRREITRHKDNIEKATYKVSKIFVETGGVLETKKMKVSDFKKMVYLTKEVEIYLDNLSMDLGTLQNFVHMYKTLKTETDVSQNEIEAALMAFQNGDVVEIDLDNLSSFSDSEDETKELI